MGALTRRKKEADRVPPYSEEAEQGVLGCVFLDADYSIPKVMEVSPLTGSIFYDARHAAIWEAICEVLNDGLKIDLITITAKLRDQRLLENVGGVAALSQFPDKVASAQSIDDYLTILREKFLLRQILSLGTTICAKAYDEKTSSELIEEAQLGFLRLGTEVIGDDVKPLSAYLYESMCEIMELSEKNRRITGIPSGFADMDYLTAGFQPGEVTIIAARPSVGKTALALNIAATVAEAGSPVGFFSLEMVGKRLTSRLIQASAQVSLREVIEGVASTAEMQKIKEAHTKLRKLPIFIRDLSQMNIIQLRSRAVQMHSEQKLGLIVIDYLQLVGGTNRARDNRAQEVGDVSAGIKAIAKDLKIPVIALAQLNRDVERDKGRAPRLGDLRESGQIEADADLVLLMHRPTSDEDAERPPPSYSVNFHLAKHRNGPTGMFTLVYVPRITKFFNAAKIEEEEKQPEFNLPKPKGRK